MWLVPRSQLTPDQIRAVELPASEHRVIVGGPGSGKTLMLLHRAAYLRERFKVSPERFRIFVFTNVLKEYIRSGLSLLDIPEDCVATFHSWCVQALRERGHRSTPWDAEAKRPDFPAILNLLLDSYRRDPPRKHPFDFILVDEGQDLEPECFEILRHISEHVTVCMDRRQQIYEKGSDAQEVLNALGLRRANVALLENYRCCPYIVEMAATLLDDPDERAAYLRQTRTTQGARETPVLRIARDAEEERQFVFDVTRTRVAAGDRVAVLLPRRTQAFGFAKGLREAGIDAEDPKTVDFTTNKPKVMPYHSAKGLTFDSVLLPRLGQSAFRQVTAERMQNILFVGITRALGWVYLSAPKGSMSPLLRRFDALASKGILTVHRSEVAGQGHMPFGKEHASGPMPGEDDDDDPIDIL